MHRVCVVLLAVMMAGCGLVRQRELKEKMASLRMQASEAMQSCNAQYPPGNRKTALARAQCVNGAFALLQPTLPYPDLLQTWMAEHMAIAEEVQNGKVSVLQANAMLAQKWSDMVAEEQRRILANRSVAAQEESASAASAAAWAASAPRTCTYGGGTVTCF